MTKENYSGAAANIYGVKSDGCLRHYLHAIAAAPSIRCHLRFAKHPHDEARPVTYVASWRKLASPERFAYLCSACAAQFRVDHELNRERQS